MRREPIDQSARGKAGIRLALQSQHRDVKNLRCGAKLGVQGSKREAAPLSKLQVTGVIQRQAKAFCEMKRLGPGPIVGFRIGRQLKSDELSQSVIPLRG